MPDLRHPLGDGNGGVGWGELPLRGGLGPTAGARAAWEFDCPGRADAQLLVVTGNGGEGVKYRFGPALAHALQIRGLDMQRVAEVARVSPATVSSAVRSHSLNMRTATRIAKVVADHSVLRELEEWSLVRITEVSEHGGLVVGGRESKNGQAGP